jgi:hypothetical protein
MDTMFCDKRRTNRLLLLLIIIAHSYALIVFGATYWIDSLNYVRLAHALKTSNGLTAFYSSDGYWFCTHIQPGIALLWLMVSQFSISWQWPMIALVQHALAVVALYFAFSTANHYWPTRWHLLSCALLCFLPFYQSFHNALLTESVSGSLLLITVALVVRLVMNIVFQHRDFMLLLVALVIVTQIRSYYGPLLALLITVALFQKRLLGSRYFVYLALSAAIAALSFPLYRARLTGDFFLPHVGGLDNLVVSSLADPRPGPSVAQAWSRVPVPTDLPSSHILASGLTWSEAEKVGMYWKTAGFTRNQVDRRAQGLAALYQRDHHFLVFQRFALALTAIGFVTPLLAGDRNDLLTVNYSAPAYAKHCIDDGYIWHSRISTADYRETFDLFFNQTNGEDQDVPGADAARIDFARAWEPHLTRVSLRFRDPFHLGSLPPDIWAAAGLISMAVVFIYSRPIGLTLFACPILNFVVLACSPLGGLRYGYALFPIYLLSCSLAAGILRNGREKIFSCVATGMAFPKQESL